jgi:hypothetical protein
MGLLHTSLMLTYAYPIDRIKGTCGSHMEGTKSMQEAWKSGIEKAISGIVELQRAVLEIDI